MDKQKQIEEMARIASINCGECYTCEFNTMPNCIDYLVANEFYNAGYRKIDEGSVVLSKEEYEALRLIEKYHIKSCGKNSVVLTTEELEEIRKQAVKEVLQWLTSKRHISDRMHEVGYEKPRTSYLVLDDEIKEIAKEFEVEL